MIFCIPHVLEKSLEYSVTLQQLFINIRNTYDSVRREVLCSIFIDFLIPIVVRLIKMCLNETIAKQLSDSFRIQNGL
jgi:hypothetical protein